jgi:putative aldouronate transport system permease protein
MWIAVLTMLFNGGLIPTYIAVQRYGLIDSYLALVLPYVVSVYNMVIMMNFFRGVPKELEEAAAIDGAGAWRTLFEVYLPVSLPTIATITLFTIVWHWNDFFAGLIYINNPDNYPLQTYIRSLTVKIDYTSISDPRVLAERLKVSGITFNAAKIVVSMIPIICVYPFLQRYFVSGLVMGSVKE